MLVMLTSNQFVYSDLYRWFMPVNVGLTFLIGGILGWILVKLLRPNLKVEGLIIAACSSGIVRDK